MRVYTVHIRPGSTQPDREAALVKEGFCWPAFFFHVLWALWHRMWLVALALALGLAAIGAAAGAVGLDPLSGAALDLGIAALIGWGANDWRRAALARRGFDLAGIVAASGGDAALRRWFDLNPA